MLPSLLRPVVPADVREEFLIAPHHPDRLGRPAARLGAITDDRFQQTLTWNVFRTLGLLAPAFWRRRFHLRRTGDRDAVPAQVLRVSLWRSLPLPPIQRIDGAQPDVVVDVIVETEHVVWTLIVANRVYGSTVHDRVTQVIDAGGWLAGAREHYFGVIEGDSDPGSIGESLKRRYARSSASLQLRLDLRGPALVGCLCAGEHFPEEATSFLKLPQDVELHQLTSCSCGSTPSSRLRNAVRHAEKATNPRARVPASARSPSAFNTAINGPYQPFTRHLHTCGNSRIRVRFEHETAPTSCSASSGLVTGSASAPHYERFARPAFDRELSSISKRNHPRKVKAQRGAERAN